MRLLQVPEARLFAALFDRRQWLTWALILGLPLVLTAGFSQLGGAAVGMEDFSAWRAARSAGLSQGLAIGLGLLLGLITADISAELKASPALALMPNQEQRWMRAVTLTGAVAFALGALVGLIAGAAMGPVILGAEAAVAASLPWCLRHGLFHWKSLLAVAAALVVFAKLGPEPWNRPLAVGCALLASGVAGWLARRHWRSEEDPGARLSIVGFGDSLERLQRQQIERGPKGQEPVDLPATIRTTADWQAAVQFEACSARGRRELPSGIWVALPVYLIAVIKPLLDTLSGTPIAQGLQKCTEMLAVALFGDPARRAGDLMDNGGMINIFVSLLIPLATLGGLFALRQRWNYPLSRSDRAQVAAAWVARLSQGMVLGQLLVAGGLVALLLLFTEHRYPGGFPPALGAILAGLALEPILLRYMLWCDRRLRRRGGSGLLAGALLLAMPVALSAPLLYLAVAATSRGYGGTLWLLAALALVAFHGLTRKQVWLAHFRTVEL